MWLDNFFFSFFFFLMCISGENVRLASDWHAAFLVVYVASVLTSPAVSADTFQQLRCLSIAHGTTRSSVCKCTFMTCRVWSVFWFHSEEGRERGWGGCWHHRQTGGWVGGGAHTFILELMIVSEMEERETLTATSPHPPCVPEAQSVHI